MAAATIEPVVTIQLGNQDELCNRPRLKKLKLAATS